MGTDQKYCRWFNTDTILWKMRNTETRTLENKILDHVKEILHLLPKISMFCALSQDNQQLFWKIDYASYKKLFKEHKNGI